jgi:non-homologous end joining protein Ku
MPRATWKGFLRLSLVSFPVYLMPATMKAKTIRLNQVWMPRTDRPEPDLDEDDDDRPVPRPSTRSIEPPPPGRRPLEGPDDAEPASPIPLRPNDRVSASPTAARPDDVGPAARIALQPVDRQTGEKIERDQVVKGYEFDRGQFVTFTAAELKSLDVESSRTIDLTTFVPRVEIDPIYFNQPYLVYPDGAVATEAFRVIGAAMADAGVAGIGRITLSRRERPVMVEPRGAPAWC